MELSLSIFSYYLSILLLHKDVLIGRCLNCILVDYIILYIRTIDYSFNILDELKSYLTGEFSKMVPTLREFGTSVSLENEVSCWKYLQTRAKILMFAYPDKIQVCKTSCLTFNLHSNIFYINS